MSADSHHAADRLRRLRRISRVARLMDTAIRVPGTGIRFGADSVVGLIPGIGDAGGAVIAAIFGWIHTGLWFGGDTAMQLHRWNGMLIAVLGVVLAALAHRRPESRTMLRIALAGSTTISTAR